MYLRNFYIPYKIIHNSKPVLSVQLSIRKRGRPCRVCDRHGASVCAEGTRNIFKRKGGHRIMTVTAWIMLAFYVVVLGGGSVALVTYSLKKNDI